MIEYDIGEPRRNGTALLQGLISLAQVIVLVEIVVGVVVVTDNVNYS